MENLWKKESNEPSSLYVELIDSSVFSNGVERAAEKSNAIADNHRTAGNQLFQQKQWPDAMEEYNKSLCYAVVGTESISLAYANRASCFLHLGLYEKCLADIELAIKSSYPQRLMPKLEQRKADCMAKIDKQPITMRAREPELSYPPNEMIPCMSNVLEIQQNEKFGRHIVAKCDIPAGKTIMLEPSFITATNIGRAVCSTCHWPDLNFMPCTKCTTAMFCSAKCKKKSRAYHAKECGYAFDGVEYGHESTQFLVRSILKAVDVCGGTFDKLMAFVENVRHKPLGIPTSTIGTLNQYRTFLQLWAYIPLRDNEEIARRAFAYHIITTMPEMKQLFDTLPKQRFLMHLLVMHHLIIVGNHLNPNSVTAGLITSFYNHRCMPNVSTIAIDNKIVSVTTLPVQKGEQLFLSYCGANQTDRRQYLFCHYQIWCECSKCVPIAIPPNQLRAIDRHLCFIKGDIALIGYDVSRFHEVEALCINFLNAYGHLPFNASIELVATLLMDYFELLCYCGGVRAVLFIPKSEQIKSLN